MKIAQIATLLNTQALLEMTGQSVLVTEDLTNIVDVGKAVLDFTNQSTDNFNTYITGLIDQIGKMKFVDRVYKSKAPSILVDSNEYGSIMAKVRVEVPEFQETSSWKLGTLAANVDANGYNGIGQNPELDPFILALPEAEMKFWNTKTTYTAPITIGKKQLKESFRSPEEMQRFIAMIENRIATKRTLSNDAMIMRCINNFMGLKIAQTSGGYIDLAAQYATDTGNTAPTAANYKANADFLRYVSMYIDQMRSYFEEASILNNQGNGFSNGYVTFTPEDKQKLVILKELDSALRFNLYGNTYHEEYIKLEGYDTVNSWQGVGTSNIVNTQRGGIDIQCTDGTNTYAVETTTNDAVILGALFDIEGCTCTNKDDRVTSQWNPRTESTTFFYMYDACYLNDVVENGIVFTIGTPSVT